MPCAAAELPLLSEPPWPLLAPVPLLLPSTGVDAEPLAPIELVEPVAPVEPIELLELLLGELVP